MDSGNGGDFFSTYLHQLNQDQLQKFTKWNELRINHHSENENQKKIVNQELKQIDFNHPLECVNKRYQQEKYCKSLLHEELDDLNDGCDRNTITSKIVDKCEKIGRVQTILDCLLNFILEKNLNLISKIKKFIK